MNSFEVQFGEWLPDQATYKNPGLVEADNCYPSSGGYAPFVGVVDYGGNVVNGEDNVVNSGNQVTSTSSEATTEQVKGAELFIRNDGTPLVCLGSETILATRIAGALTETTGYTALAADSAWQFERFSDLIVAVSPENVPQYLDDLDSDTSWSALPGNPPKAGAIGKVDDFLVLGDLTDIAGLGSPVVPNRVRWSARNNPTADWVTDRGELSDYRDLDPKYGRVTAIAGGRFGLVFQERAIWRMTYVGAPSAFQFDLVSADRGCVARGSVVTIGFETFFLSEDGFYVTNGSQVEPIGSQRVNEWFLDNANQALVKRTHGSINWPARCIVWNFVPNGTTDFRKQIIYSFTTNRWSSATQFFDYLVQTRQDALTIGDLAALFPQGIGSMSAYELGTAEWQARNLALAAFVDYGAGSVFAPLYGNTVEANFVTGDMSLEPGFRSHVTGVMPMVENESADTLTSVRAKERQGGMLTVTTPSAQGADGYCPHKSDAWFHSFRMTIPANASWDNASGMWVRARRSGRR